MDKVELVLERPGRFCVIDFELYICRDPTSFSQRLLLPRVTVIPSRLGWAQVCAKDFTVRMFVTQFYGPDSCACTEIQDTSRLRDRR